MKVVIKFKDGKSKALTLSYDDGVVYDTKFAEILNKYGIKCTFNISSGKYRAEGAKVERANRFLSISEAKSIYLNSGHEVASHSYTHPWLDKLTIEEAREEMVKDIDHIENTYGIRPRGMAYPYGTFNDEVVEMLRECGICYGRTTKKTEDFKVPKDWLRLEPTCHHICPKLMELADKFINEEKPSGEDLSMFYLWGHSYEFNDAENWYIIEEFAEKMGNREDIWYATNIEIYDYIKASESLEISDDENTIYNPTDIDIWINDGEKDAVVKAKSYYKK